MNVLNGTLHGTASSMNRPCSKPAVRAVPYDPAPRLLPVPYGSTLNQLRYSSGTLSASSRYASCCQQCRRSSSPLVLERCARPSRPLPRSFALGRAG